MVAPLPFQLLLLLQLGKAADVPGAWPLVSMGSLTLALPALAIGTMT